MTVMARVNVPARTAPDSAFLPLQKGLSNGQHTFSPVKKLGCQRNSLSAAPLLIQPKLTIGESDDQYEREADRVAETVMRMPEPEIQRKPT